MRLKHAYMIGGVAYGPGTILFPVPFDLVEREAPMARYDHWEPGMRARLIEEARNCVRGHHFLARVWDQPHVYVIDTIAVGVVAALGIVCSHACSTGAGARAIAQREAEDYYRRNFGARPTATSCSEITGDGCTNDGRPFRCSAYGDGGARLFCCDGSKPWANDGCGPMRDDK